MVAPRPAMRLGRCARRTGFGILHRTRSETQQAPRAGPVAFLAERGTILAFPRISENVRNSFSILHLANSLR